MTGWIGRIRRVFERPGKHSGAAEAEIDRLRVEFRDRYHSFKLLLGANSKALEIMADMERALSGRQPFGMAFVRSHCTSVSVNVYNMLQYLNRLAPERYAKLAERYREIRSRVEKVLARKKTTLDPRLVIPLEDTDWQMSDSVGSKMANLGELLRNTRVAIPPGFVITARAYQQFLEHNDLQPEIERRIQAADLENMDALYRLSAQLQQIIIQSRIPEQLAEAISGAWQQVEIEAGRPVSMAFRSSAVGEDVAGSSFAGQYRSELNISREHALEAYKEILASKYSLPAVSYRLRKGFRDEDIPMCVGCMVMVDAVAGGVTYSRNPVDIRDSAIHINAVPGLPKAVVDGSTAGDLFVVSRDEPMRILREDIRRKTRKFVCYPEEGVCRIDLSGDAGVLPALEHRQVLRLAGDALAIERFYEAPQDIEWAVDDKETVVILQCRPMTQSGGTDSTGSETVQASVSIDPGAADRKSVILKGGITASTGAASGTVYRVDTGADVLGFPEGAVLAARQARPEWASMLGRAVAVVTEQGGFAGHLANVAREFGVPALFGLKGALDRLKTGDTVTVDATGRVIHEGKVNAPTEEKKKAAPPMAGSPVHETLKAVSRHIVPLHLLDPEAPEFKPENCATFHDMTRFIHEKSVHEMFNFGREHRFSERSGKQLFYHVPMQWWILNLDDGFRHEVKGKYVRLEDIVSWPMRAFWEGFVAVSWDGPPPVDGRGLMSVMFQSTRNPALTPGVRSKYADRNYFMISRHYCNLNSRLGYHFSILEALVSERNAENYISFQFKGGAADRGRRLKRVRFIREILENYDFRVEINEDHLISRIDGHDKSFMLDRLRILGYLTLHTRQLDMIMANAGRVRYYRSKIEEEIQRIIFTSCKKC